MSFKIDFRFVEIEYELSALQEYIRTLDSQLPILEKREREELEKRIHEQNLDEADASMEYDQHHDLIKRVVPRFFRGPVLVTLWAIYESGVQEVASHIQNKQSWALASRDIRGDNKLAQFKKYYEYILKFPLITSDPARERIEMLQVLRNALAHGNGRKDAVKDWEKIEKWSQTNKGIIADHDYLMFTGAFVQETFTIVSDSLRDLIQRTKSAY